MFWEFGSSVAPLVEPAEPLRDDVGDHSRDPAGDSREDEKTETLHKDQAEHSDVSMLGTLTELLLNPFLDGYCQTPFCSGDDYLPPNCPSGHYYYTTPDYSKQQQQQNQQQQTAGTVAATPVGNDFDDDICKSPSSSSVTSSQGKRRRRRPLALAVGYGHDWKDMDGRRVVITPSASRMSQYHHQQQHHPAARPVACTCQAPGSTNSLVVPESYANNSPESPHQSKHVMCKFCSNNKLRDLEVPASHSSGTISSRSQPVVPPQSVVGGFA